MAELPTTLKLANQSIYDFSCIFTGEKTTGKSSLAFQYPSHFAMEFEVGNARHLDGNYQDVGSWEEFVQYCDLLKANPNYCKTLILDGINKLDYYCYQYVRKFLRLEDTDKDDYPTWRIKKQLMSSYIEGLRKLPFNVIFTAHTEVVSLTDLKGAKVNRLQADLSGQLKEYFNELNIAVWGVLHKGTDNQTLMQIVGDSFIMASHKLKDHFRWNGYRIKVIPLGFSPEEGFRNFNAAFANQLQVPDQYLIKNEPPLVVSNNGEPTKPKVVFK